MHSTDLLSAGLICVPHVPSGGGGALWLHEWRPAECAQGGLLPVSHLIPEDRFGVLNDLSSCYAAYTPENPEK